MIENPAELGVAAASRVCRVAHKSCDDEGKPKTTRIILLHTTFRSLSLPAYLCWLVPH